MPAQRRQQQHLLMIKDDCLMWSYVLLQEHLSIENIEHGELRSPTSIPY